MILVKKIIILIVKPLKYICNASFQQGLFPDKMKTAKVLPLFKAGSKKKSLQIIDRFQFCPNFQTFWKNCL